MGKDSQIEWTHHTFNPWWGCDRVSPACKHCYADTWSRRVGYDIWGRDEPRRTLSDAYWRQPVAWDREAASDGVRRRVFCASMADVFEDRRDLDPLRERLWDLIGRTPNLDWLLLTKRPQVVGRLVPWADDWPHNVWLGTTVENQRWANRRLPELTAHPANVRFLSCEPLLGPIDLDPWLQGVGWVIVGGESGGNARPMNPQWAESLRDQCGAAGIPFHFKQWGNWMPAVDGHINGFRSRLLRGSDGAAIPMVNVGKKQAGRLLAGRAWDGLPLRPPMQRPLN